jgi:hypothetical protein
MTQCWYTAVGNWLADFHCDFRPIAIHVFSIRPVSPRRSLTDNLARNELQLDDPALGDAAISKRETS